MNLMMMFVEALVAMQCMYVFTNVTEYLMLFFAHVSGTEFYY